LDILRDLVVVLVTLVFPLEMQLDLNVFACEISPNMIDAKLASLPDDCGNMIASHLCDAVLNIRVAGVPDID
jgi:hypothetical protein